MAGNSNYHRFFGLSLNKKRMFNLLRLFKYISTPEYESPSADGHFDQTAASGATGISLKNEKCDEGSERGLPEILVEAQWSFWILVLILRGQKYKILQKNGQKNCQKYYHNYQTNLIL